jgi:mono/diheme cytochrome c family protein
MKKLNILSSLTFILFCFSSCYYDKEDQLYPSSSICDNSAPATYATTIVPLLQQYCYTCHGGAATSGGGIAMGTYAADKAMALNGSLYGSIAHAASYSPMPKGLNKLTDCQISKVKKWIDTGSLNN